MLVDDKAVGARIGDRDQRALPLVRPHVADMGIVALIALDEGVAPRVADQRGRDAHRAARVEDVEYRPVIGGIDAQGGVDFRRGRAARSEEHTSELQSLMRISYAVFCLKKKKQ